MKDFHYADNAVNKMGLGIDEVVSATINFSRKNYADHFPDNPFPKDVKLVGNTIKSKKMPIYIDKFLTKAVRLLLNKKGQEFLNEYYAYISKIYNYQIPLKDIASKGKIKKSIEEYIEDCKTVNIAGNPKSRQAWMELAIQNNIEVNLGETIYYINTGVKKSESDVKKVTHYYQLDENGVKQDVRVKMDKEYKKFKAENKGTDIKERKYVEMNYPDVSIEDEIILNCVMLSSDVVNSEEDVFCEEGKEYNVAKYLEQFNNRIKPLLVCFSPDIRQKILITNPSDRPYFTDEECKLDNGNPNKPSDQDTYEALMTMDDREIRFWMNHPEWKIPFLTECGMNWEQIVSDYNYRVQRAKEIGADLVREDFNKAVNRLTLAELQDFSENGVLPSSIEKLITVDPVTGNFVHKEYNDIVIGTIYDILDAIQNKEMELENYAYEEQ